MRIRKHLMAVGLALAAWLTMGGLAAAAFPNFSDCPAEGLPSGSGCVDIQSQEGELEIKGFHVPLDHSLEIRGAIREPEGTFIAPRGTNGFFAEPVNVPGGLLGIELPISLNLVLATAELAGSPSDIQIRAGDQTVRLPLKVRLSNPLIGSNCHIGSNRNPVWASLIPGTTEPPPPNRPISGRFGAIEFLPPDTLLVLGTVVVENSFAIPGAQECGLFGLIDLLVDAKLKLPSAAGNNSLVVENDSALRLLP
jgi:hypothetical protein